MSDRFRFWLEPLSEDCDGEGEGDSATGNCCDAIDVAEINQV